MISDKRNINSKMMNDQKVQEVMSPIAFSKDIESKKETMCVLKHDFSVKRILFVRYCIRLPYFGSTIYDPFSYSSIHNLSTQNVRFKIDNCLWADVLFLESRR